MRLATKLTLLFAAAGALPVAMVAVATIGPSAAELRRQLTAAHARTAEALAGDVDQLLEDRLGALSRSAEALRLSAFDDEELRQVLVLVYRQVAGAGAVGLLDARGNAVVPPVYSCQADPAHEAMEPAGLQAFARGVPLAAALSSGRAVGPPYVQRDPKGVPIPRVVLAVGVPGRAGSRWVLAAEISLRDIASRLSATRVGGAALLDREGRVVAHRDPALVESRADLSSHPVLSGTQTSGLLGAAAAVRLTGWRVLVEQPAAEMLAPVRRQERAAAVGIGAGLVVALLLGLLAARSLTRPIDRLREAALRVQSGDLDVVVEPRGHDELAQLGDAFNAMVAGLRDRGRLRGSLKRYLSGEVARRILSEKDDLAVREEMVEVSVAFVDVRGFTALSEQLRPSEVVELLNAYFTVVVAVVARHGGQVNKFIGDAAMILFLADDAPPDPMVFGEQRKAQDSAIRAVAAAVDIQREAVVLSEARAGEGKPVAQLGVGVNTGPAIAGNLGPADRMEYTVIGDAVNLAERLQAQALPGEVVVSAPTCARVRHLWRMERGGEVTVKGKAKPVEIFKVVERWGGVA